MSDYLADQLRAFDPNQKKHVPYATWGNHGGFKLHLHRGGATTRYGTNDYAVYYEMGDNGLWTEIFRKCRPDENFTCTMCGHTTRLAEGMFDPTLTYGWRGLHKLDDVDGVKYWDTGRYTFVRRSRKIVQPMVQHFACIPCWDLIA